MPDGDDITQVGQAQEQAEITNTQEPVAGLGQESDTFFPLPGQENIKEKIISKPYNYSKKAFAIDKGDLRDIESVKKMVKRHYLITDSELGEKIKKTKDGIKRVDGEINPHYTEFFIPLKVDKDKLVGESGSKEHQYYPVEIHDEGLNESQQKKLHKRHKEKRGFFDKIKIKFSNVNLNTDNTLLDEDDLLDENESMARRVVKGIARTLIGSRTVRKNFNEEYGKDEPVTQITESSSSEINSPEDEAALAEPSQSENNNYENSQYASQIEQAKNLGRAYLEKILNFGSIKIGVPFINLTSKGLLMDFMSAVSIQEKYKGLIKSSVIVKFGKKFSLNYLGSELKSNAIKIGSSNSILVNLGSVTLLHDPSTSSDLWEMNEFDLSATILNGTVESKLSASLIEYDSITGFRIENGYVQGDVKIGEVNGSVRLGGILYENNTLKSFGGIGTLNKIPLTSNFLISDISIVVGYDGSSYIIDGAADIDFNSSLTPIGLEDFHLTGKVNVNRDSSNESLNYSLINGNLNASFLDQMINIKGVNYSSNNPKDITALYASWKGTILDHQGVLFILNPKISDNEGFNFKKITGVIYDLNYGQYVTTDFLEIGLEKDGAKYKINGATQMQVNSIPVPGLENASMSGLFTASGYSDGTEINYSITNGNLNASFLGQDIKIKGVNYSSENPKDIIALYASWKGTILDHQGALFILNPKISDNEGFNFKKITGVIYDVSYGDYISTDFIEIGIEKINTKYKISGTTKAEISPVLPGLENTKISGDFSASGFEDGTDMNYKISAGELETTILNNKIQITGGKYNSKESDKFSADNFSWNGTIFEQTASFSITKPEISNSKGFDFDSATGKLDKFTLGEWGELSNIGFHMQKGEDGNYYYSGTGKVKFGPNNSIFGISLGTYNITLDNLNFNSNSFSFDSASIEGFTNSFSFGVFEFSPTKMTLFNSATKKGVEFELNATMNNVLPAPLNGENSFEGGAKIKTSLLKSQDKLKSSYKVLQANFTGRVINPLNSLNVLEGWGSNRLDIGASILVFPGVFADFGLFIESMLNFGNAIIINIKKDGESGISVEITSNVAEGKIAAGAYAGVQAGSALIASIGLYLEAFGKIDAALIAKFKKVFPISDANADLSNPVTLILEGDATVAAQLKAVAKALYIFKKVWTYEIGSRELGHFKFSNVSSENKGFNGSKEKLVENQPNFNNKALDEEKVGTAEKHQELKNMKTVDLLELGADQRWSRREKSDIVKKFKDQENINIEDSRIGNSTKLRPENENTEEISEKFKIQEIDNDKINRSHHTDLKHKRNELAQIRQVHAKANNLNIFGSFIESRIAPELNQENLNPDLNALYGENKIAELKQYIGLLDNNINIAQKFVSHYHKTINTVGKVKKNKLLEEEISYLHNHHNQRGNEVSSIEKIKKDNLRPFVKNKIDTANVIRKFPDKSKMSALKDSIINFKNLKDNNTISEKNLSILKKIGKKEYEFTEQYKSLLAS